MRFGFEAQFRSTLDPKQLQVALLATDGLFTDVLRSEATKPKAYDKWYIVKGNHDHYQYSHELISPVFELEDGLSKMTGFFKLMKKLNLVTSDYSLLDLNFSPSSKEASIDLLKLAVFLNDSRYITSLLTSIKAVNSQRLSSSLAPLLSPSEIQKSVNMTSILTTNSGSYLQIKKRRIEFKHHSGKDYQFKEGAIIKFCHQAATAIEIASDPTREVDKYQSVMKDLLTKSLQEHRGFVTHSLGNWRHQLTDRQSQVADLTKKFNQLKTKVVAHV